MLPTPCRALNTPTLLENNYLGDNYDGLNYNDLISEEELDALLDDGCVSQLFELPESPESPESPDLAGSPSGWGIDVSHSHDSSGLDGLISNVQSHVLAEFRLPRPPVIQSVGAALPEYLITGKKKIRRPTNKKDHAIADFAKNTLVLHKGKSVPLKSSKNGGGSFMDALNGHLQSKHPVFPNKADPGRVKAVLIALGVSVEQVNICRICGNRAFKTSCGKHWDPRRRTKWDVLKGVTLEQAQCELPLD